MHNLSPEEEDLLDSWKTLPMDKKAAKVINKSKPGLDLLRQAAQIRPCNWGLAKGRPNAHMPHFAMALKAARLACLRARYLAGTLDSEGAVSDLLAVFVLARQINSDGPSLGFSLQCLIEEMATDTAAACLTQLTREQLRRLAAGLDALPPCKEFREVVLNAQADAKYWTDSFCALDDRAKENQLKALLMNFDVDILTLVDPVTGDEALRARFQKQLAETTLTPEELSEYTRGFDKVPEYYHALAEMGSLRCRSSTGRRKSFMRN